MTNLKLIILSVVLLFSKAVSGQITSAAPYCAGGYDDMMGFPVSHYISNVTFGTLANATGTTQFPGQHYAYYNTLTAPSLTAGSTYPLSVTHDGGASIHFVAVYIDFNQNNSFADPGERVLHQTIATGPAITNPATASVTIPLTATAGTTRMRVMVFEDDDYTWMGGAVDAVPCTPDAGGLLDWGETEDYNVNIVAAGGGCSPVTGLAAGSVTSTGATISWAPVTGAVGYQWAVNTSATPPASGTPITATSTPAGTLTPSTNYFAHVRTNCGTGFSTWTTIPFTTLAPPSCPPVTGLAASAITWSGATISWAPVTGAAGYEWSVTTSATPPATGTPITATTTPSGTLAASTNYFAHVRTNCGTSFSTWTTIPFTTPAPSCAPVTGLTAGAITTSSAIISWTAVAGSTGYQYEVNTSATPPTGPGTNIVATTTNVTALTSGTTYYAHVRNNCGGGIFSAWTTIPFTTPACNAPTALTITSITKTSAIINWIHAAGAMRAQWIVNTTATAPTIAGASTTSASVLKTDLLPGTLYYAHVRDSCAAGLSAWITKPFVTLSPVGIDDLGTGGFDLTAYPNPAKDAITIEVTGAKENALIVLTDIAGHTIQTVTMNNTSANIDMNHLPSGIYIVRYMDGEHTKNIKISKQ